MGNREHEEPAPCHHELTKLPLRLLSSRQSSAANQASSFADGGSAGMFFLLPVQLQVTRRGLRLGGRLDPAAPDRSHPGPLAVRW